MILNILTVLILSAFIVLAVRVFRRPGIAAALVWSMIVLEAVVMPNIPFLVQHATFINFLIGGIAGIAATWAVLNQKYRNISIPVQLWLYAALLTLCALSYFWSKSPEDTYQKLMSGIPFIVTFAIFAPMCIFDEKQLNAAIRTLMYFGPLIVLGILFSEIGNRGIIISTENGRTNEANPLAVASYAAYVAFACLFSIWGTKLLSLRSIIKMATIGICIIAMIKSGSRGQLIAFAGISIIFFPIMVKAAAKRSTILAIIGAILLTTFTVVMVDQLGLSARWDFQRLIEDQYGRLDLAETMLKLNLREGPMAWFFGLGSSSSFRYLQTYPHNVMAETLAEEGIVGLMLLVSILGLSLRQGFRLMLSESLPKQTRVNVATILAIFSFDIILSFKQGNMLGSAISIFSTGFVIAWIFSRLKKELGKKPIPRGYFMPTAPNHPLHSPRSSAN